MSAGFTDEAIILATAPLHESDTQLDVLTRAHGSRRGIVKGGAGARSRGTLQAGNHIALRWKARLPTHMGTMHAELLHPYFAWIAHDKLRLQVSQAALTLCRLHLYDQEENAALYHALTELHALALRDDELALLGGYIRFEQDVLRECGYGLDLSRCAATGRSDGLCYISPRSGRAVSAEAGAAYRDRLFVLPRCFEAHQTPANLAEVVDALTVNGYFLEKRLVTHHATALPAARHRLTALLAALDSPDSPEPKERAHDASQRYHV